MFSSRTPVQVAFCPTQHAGDLLRSYSDLPRRLWPAAQANAAMSFGQTNYEHLIRYCINEFHEKFRYRPRDGIATFYVADEIKRLAGIDYKPSGLTSEAEKSRGFLDPIFGILLQLLNARLQGYYCRRASAGQITIASIPIIKKNMVGYAETELRTQERINPNPTGEYVISLSKIYAKGLVTSEENVNYDYPRNYFGFAEFISNLDIARYLTAKLGSRYECLISQENWSTLRVVDLEIRARGLPASAVVHPAMQSVTRPVLASRPAQTPSTEYNDIKNALTSKGYNLDNLPEFPEHLRCPISHSLMFDPVFLVATGHTFDRECIVEALRHRPLTNPLSGGRIDNQEIKPNYALRNAILEAIRVLPDIASQSTSHHLPSTNAAVAAAKPQQQTQPAFVEPLAIAGVAVRSVQQSAHRSVVTQTSTWFRPPVPSASHLPMYTTMARGAALVGLGSGNASAASPMWR